MVDRCPRCYAYSRPRRRLLSLAASPDSQGDINVSDERPDGLQAANIKAVLELKGFDLGLVSSHCAENYNSHPKLLSKSTQKCKGLLGPDRGGSRVNVSPRWPDKRPLINCCRVKASALAKPSSVWQEQCNNSKTG